MDETRLAEPPAERQPATPTRPCLPFRAAWRLLPGLLAGLLFLHLAAGAALFGAAAPTVSILLASLLAGSIAAQPAVLYLLRRLALGPRLAHIAALAGVVALSALMRFWGLRFGLPYLDHPDEWAVADRAVRIIQTGDYNPGSFVYPSLYTYLQAAVASVHFLWGASAGLYRALNDIDPARYYVWGRALTALLGSAAVLLTYILGRVSYGATAGLLAAAFLAVYPAAAGDAHYLTTDTPSMFFTLLAFLAIARLGLGASTDHRRPTTGDRPPATDHRRPTTDQQSEDRTVSSAAGGRQALLQNPGRTAGRRTFYALGLLAGLAVGLATATKYNVASLVVPLALALCYRAYDLSRLSVEPRAASTVRLATCAALWSLLGLIVGFTLGTPYWLRELPQLLNDLASVLVHYRITGHPGAESGNPALFYWGAFNANGVLLAWAFLAGALLAFVRRRRADLLVLAFVVSYFLQMAGVKVVFFRNTMPLLPFLCVLAAGAVVALTGMLRDRIYIQGASIQNPKSKIQNALARSPVHPLALTTLLFLIILTAQPLALIVRDNWLRAQPTTRILATEWVERSAEAGTRIWLEDQTLILSERLRVQGGRPVTDQSPEWFVQNGFRFLVVNEDARRENRERLAAFGEPAARFAPDGERLGPKLSIYDTGYGDPSRDRRTPSGATLGAGALTLDGYQHAGTAQPGTILRLALYWRANRALPQDYTVFVHLLDPRGVKVAQRDLPPLDGRRPTGSWQPGELLRDDQDLPLPGDLAPGTYRLVVGMYDPATLVAINDQGPIDVGEVVIR
jgi:4-amino-4-deoxy-L-arabinose transferase-like glycosyltransferase